MYFTDRGIEELEDRRGQQQVSVAWLARRLRDFVDENPDLETAVDRLATWLARLDDEEDLLSERPVGGRPRDARHGPGEGKASRPAGPDAGPERLPGRTPGTRHTCITSPCRGPFSRIAGDWLAAGAQRCDSVVVLATSMAHRCG